MGKTHLEIHTGKTKQIRAQEATPTDPAPGPGDIYYDTTSGLEAIGIRNQTGWLYVSTIPA
jgi:hypothetical protein